MAKIDPKLAEGINRQMADFLLENYERYYLFIYSMVKNEEQVKRIISKTIYFSLYNGRKLKGIPRMRTWFYQLIVKDSLRKMHELDKYKRDFTYESQLYAFMETIEPSAVNTFRLFYFENMSISEIGEILHLKDAEVEKRLKYVRRELKIDVNLEDESADRMNELIRVYESPKIPDDLEDIINDTIARERADFEKYLSKQSKNRILKPLILIACLVLWFFGTIAVAKGNENFAEMVKAVPFIRSIFIPFI